MLEVDASLLAPNTNNTPNVPPTQLFMGIAAIDPNKLASSTEFFEHSRFATTFKFDLAYIMELPTLPATSSIYHTSSTTIAKSTESNPFYIDSGSSGHLTPNSEDFFELRPIPPHPINGIGGSIMALGIGNIKIELPNREPIVLYNAIYIPKSGVCLISVSSLWCFSQFYAPFLGEIAHITNSKDGYIIAYASLIPQKELYVLNVITPTALLAQHAFTTTSTPTFKTWHKRMGHTNYQCLEHMARKGMVKDMPTSFPSAPPKCESCLLGKQTKLPVPKKRVEGLGHRATRKLEKVWVDLTGPQATASRTGNLYIMDIVDDYTNRPWAIPLKRKDEALPQLQAWQLRIETLTGLKIGTFYCDRGELKSNDMEEWLMSRGTSQVFTAPYTSAHIGRVERMHRTLMGKARTMRIDARCPEYLWDEFYLTAAHLHEKTWTRSLDNKTPYEAWYGRKPDYSYMREIGCKAFVLILNRHNPKVYERSIETILIGYDLNSKTYRCYDPKRKVVYTSYHVRFIESHETSIPLPQTPQPIPPSVTEITNNATSTPIYFDAEEEEEILPSNLHQPIPDDPENDTHHEDPDTDHDRENLKDQMPPDQRRSNRSKHVTGQQPTRLEEIVKEVKESAERKKAAKEERRRLKDIREEEKRNIPAVVDERARQELGDLDDPKTMPKVNDQNIPVEELCEIFGQLDIGEQPNLTRQTHTILPAIANCSEIDPQSFADSTPKNWNEAQLTPEASEWRSAIDDELRSLREMGVYVLVPRSDVPQTSKIRKGQMLLSNKTDENGNITRRKARFVFKGYEQRWGVDFTSTTSPTARMESWRILLHIAATLGWDSQQIDIKTAFLYGLLPDDEVQYMEQPRGFEETGKETWIWKLQRGLYGMKQSGRIWNKTMNEAMISWGFTRLTCESCIYYRKADTGIIIAAVHVDDFLSIASTTTENERFKEQMKTIWKISSSGEARYCVGIAITRDRETHSVSLSQTALIDKIITQFGQQDSYPANSPMDPGLKLRRPDKKSITSEDRDRFAKLPYRSLVGCLIYLSVGTRPDISYSVQQLSQFLDCYSYSHWNAAIRVVRYLKGTRTLRLRLGGTEPVKLAGFTDSDWANCLDTRRSVGGYGFTLGSGLISWSARKQKTVATSSCEAEYTAAFEASKEAIWLRALLTTIDFTPPSSTVILCDNNAAINLSEDPSLHQRVKHIDIKYHFLRERVQSNEISLAYINTNDNLADIFTKALEHRRFARLRNLLGIIMPSSDS